MTHPQAMYEDEHAQYLIIEKCNGGDMLDYLMYSWLGLGLETVSASWLLSLSLSFPRSLFLSRSLAPFLLSRSLARSLSRSLVPFLLCLSVSLALSLFPSLALSFPFLSFFLFLSLGFDLNRCF